MAAAREAGEVAAVSGPHVGVAALGDAPPAPGPGLKVSPLAAPPLRLPTNFFTPGAGGVAARPGRQGGGGAARSWRAGRPWRAAGVPQPGTARDPGPPRWPRLRPVEGSGPGPGAGGQIPHG